MWTMPLDPGARFRDQSLALRNACNHGAFIDILARVVGEVALAPQGIEQSYPFGWQADRERECLNNRRVVPGSIGVRPVPVGQQGGQSDLHDRAVRRIEACFGADRSNPRIGETALRGGEQPFDLVRLGRVRFKLPDLK